MQHRSESFRVQAQHGIEGGGFPIRRPFPTPHLSYFDPFLLLDEMGPVDWPPGEAIGAPDHPHRGFETVTYLLEGAVEHADSWGHRSVIGPGDVQWMTAGAGVIHSELPPEDFLAKGGRMHGFQIWVNLPRDQKMRHPRYQEIRAAQIPRIHSPDGKAELVVIAGDACGVTAHIDTTHPILFLHLRLQPGGSLEIPVDSDIALLAHVFQGAGECGGAAVESGEMIAFAPDGDCIVLSTTDPAGCQALVLGGQPLHEPVARYGPFVMNTRAEILQAIEDYNNGCFLPEKPPDQETQ
jgi:redox-sensitive bicupin YhaK (pirin superfamily)